MTAEGPDDILAIGEVAARSGVAISTLHFYEREGLIASDRSAGNQRQYRRDVLRRISFIRVSQRVGIPLREIGDALQSLPESRTPTVADWARLSRRWRDRLDARIQDLEHLRRDLKNCIGCGCLSLRSCALNNPADTLAEHGPGPRIWEDPTP
jgi:MerR family transcriptional regulator, redox-sensitive transcriptional activator SoxR